MTKEILSHYGLNSGNFHIEQIGSGLINKTWRLKNEDADLILQKINTDVFPSPASISENVNKVAKYLEQHFPKYTFSKNYSTVDHKHLVHVEGDGYYRLTAFVSGSHTIDTVQNPKQAYEAAKQFGKLTSNLSGFPKETLVETLPDFHNLSLRYEQFLQALENGNGERINQSIDLIGFMKENKSIVTTYKRILENPAFKLRVTHHDTKISNVLYDDEDRGICVIDLDTLMPGYFISDVGDMMRTYLSPVSEEEVDFSKISIRNDYFLAIRDGYLSEMGNELSTDEKKHFVYSGKFMIYMQALRFLTDHLNDDRYYGARYNSHNLIRAGNQATLLQRLLEKEEHFKSLMEVGQNVTSD